MHTRLFNSRVSSFQANFIFTCYLNLYNYIFEVVPVAVTLFIAEYVHVVFVLLDFFVLHDSEASLK